MKPNDRLVCCHDVGRAAPTPEAPWVEGGADGQGQSHPVVAPLAPRRDLGEPTHETGGGLRARAPDPQGRRDSAMSHPAAFHGRFSPRRQRHGQFVPAVSAWRFHHRRDYSGPARTSGRHWCLGRWPNGAGRSRYQANVTVMRVDPAPQPRVDTPRGRLAPGPEDEPQEGRELRNRTKGGRKRPPPDP